MKKLLSVLMVAVMLVAFAVPAFASSNSPIVDNPALDGTVESTNSGIVVNDYVPAPGEDSAQDLVDQAVQSGVTDIGDATEAVVVEVELSGAEKHTDDTVQVVITYDGDGHIEAAASKHTDKSGNTTWNEVTVEYLGGNQYRLTIKGLSPVVLFIADGPATLPSNPTKPSTTGPKSPKTGY